MLKLRPTPNSSLYHIAREDRIIKKAKVELYKNFWVGIDWLFPPVCGGCERPGTRSCQDCQKKIQVIEEPVCSVCGLPQIHSGLCERCEEKRPSFKLLRSWTVFEEPVRKALHRLKYRRDIGLGEALSNQMSGFVA